MNSKKISKNNKVNKRKMFINWIGFTERSNKIY